MSDVSRPVGDPEASAAERHRKAPMPVNIATVILYLYGALLVIIGVLSLVALANADTTGSEDRNVLTVAGIGFLAVGILLVLLGWKLVQGRVWALVTILVLLGLNAIQAIVRDATGALNVGVAILIALLLLVPRSSREHFGIG